MKTIGYRDNAGGPLYYWENMTCTEKKNDRIKRAIADLRHVGNITVYLLKGNKTRRLFTKGF